MFYICDPTWRGHKPGQNGDQNLPLSEPGKRAGGVYELIGLIIDVTTMQVRVAYRGTQGTDDGALFSCSQDMWAERFFPAPPVDTSGMIAAVSGGYGGLPDKVITPKSSSYGEGSGAK